MSNHFGRGGYRLCGAHARSSGEPCRQIAMANGRCYYHGGRSTGPTTPEGKARHRKAVTKHGAFAGPGHPDHEKAGPKWPGHQKGRKQIRSVLRRLKDMDL